MNIYGTLGPACQSEAVLKKMFEYGMTGIRLNLSHTTLHDAAESIETMHRAAAAAGIEPELLIDMQGPELRIGPLKESIQLQEGENIEFSDGREAPVQIPAQSLPLIRQGQEILLDDGKILCRVTEVSRTAIRAVVLRGGVLLGRKSIAFPGLLVPMPAMTEVDKVNIRCAKEYGVTGVMQPFVRSPQDLKDVRQELEQAGTKNIRLFAKIENTAGIEQIDALIPWADEIVIARGDLGNAVPLWTLPRIQKEISEKCLLADVPFMVVTQMLASMDRSPVPTRAEVSDIFNAVSDGASAVMITGESASGLYPVRASEYLVKTAMEGLKWRREREKRG